MGFSNSIGVVRVLLQLLERDERADDATEMKDATVDGAQRCFFPLLESRRRFSIVLCYRPDGC